MYNNEPKEGEKCWYVQESHRISLYDLVCFRMSLDLNKRDWIHFADKSAWLWVILVISDNVTTEFFSSKISKWTGEKQQTVGVRSKRESRVPTLACISNLSFTRSQGKALEPRRTAKGKVPVFSFYPFTFWLPLPLSHLLSLSVVSIRISSCIFWSTELSTEKFFFLNRIFRNHSPKTSDNLKRRQK